MPCCSCVQKRIKYMLSRPRITQKHDLIWIMEEAERQVEAKESVQPLTKTEVRKEMAKLGYDPDYYQGCTASGSCSCYGISGFCTENWECVNPTDTCACACPAASKAHSHYVSNTCSKTTTNNCTCSYPRCAAGKTCKCACNGVCWYNCDDGYQYNPVTGLCELIPVPPAKPLINMPLVNPILVNPPLVRALGTMLPQSALELQLADTFLLQTKSYLVF